MAFFSRIARWATTLAVLCLAVILVHRPTREQHQVIGFGFSTPSSFTWRTTTTKATKLRMGFFDDIGAMLKRFNTSANASHILIKGGSEAANKLEDLKVEIGDSPVKFAEAAARYSSCPSSRNGGNLGDFGPGQMVKEFDQVVFNDEVGKVHGPIQTQFGYHLILINERTD